MTTFVIVHGAWGGGWEWSTVAELLRARGHRVFTPTLTGLGDRAHLSQREVIGLSTHVDDLVTLFEFEQLHDVTLCAASYGGMPVTGAADRTADRLARVVYVDALMPDDGQCALDLLPDAFGDMVRSGVNEHGPAWRVPMPDALFDALMPAGSLDDDVRDAYRSRVRDHPAGTFLEPVRLTGAVERLPRAFIRCTTGEFGDELGGDPIERGAARARAEGWLHRELAAPHDPQVYNPSATAELLDEIARSSAEKR